MQRFRKGATSFYIVAFSTLILVIIAASFATVIISEVTRTSNDDLSQSAYDSALAGVEDAKLAYSNYMRCVSGGKTYPDALSSGDAVTCQDIVYWMNHPEISGCDMVGRILGRIGKNGPGSEVTIEETTSTSGNGDITQMNQAYTCATINTVLNDYRANLTADNNVRVVKAQFANGVTASDIKAVKLSWYTINNTETLRFADFSTVLSPNQVTFRPIGETRPATPPTLAFQVIQTSGNFTLEKLNGITENDRTDRATMFFVPTDSASASSTSRRVNGDYQGIYNGSKNTLTAVQVARTNNQMNSDNSSNVSHLPFVTYCGDGSAAFACSVEINLPVPIQEGGVVRNDDTFMFLVTLPYRDPDTDFAIEFICNDGVRGCTAVSDIDNTTRIAQIKGMQVLIDSTGRANDLYRRVETRLESSDTSFPYTYYALEMLGEKGGEAFRKDMIVTCEGTFYDGGTYRNSLQNNPRGSNC